MAKWLNLTELNWATSLSRLGEGNDNLLQCSCLENARDRELGGLLSIGSHRVGHDWSDLVAAVAAAYTHFGLSDKHSMISNKGKFLKKVYSHKLDHKLLNICQYSMFLFNLLISRSSPVITQSPSWPNYFIDDNCQMIQPGYMHDSTQLMRTKGKSTKGF